MIMMTIAALADDNDRAFMLDLYQDYYGLVRKTVYHITYDTDHIEDLINDTFLKLLGKISLLRTLENCKMAAYVIYTTRSVAINFIKHRDVEKKYGYFGADADMAAAFTSPENAVEDKIILREEMAEMGSAILKLPEKEKTLLYFKYILDMENAELAEMLGMSQASVRSYLTRARRNAKKLIAKEMDNQDDK
jgi:RNA polymerase sigma-70 factor (ECF subfamily)